MHETKRITDPIHGSIMLTALEADIVASKAFQRLHNVRQLGLAYYVFPAANYSRFSHSLGACHNAAKMIEAVKRNGGEEAKNLADKYEQDLRLGALLHDLGHYPFSHATEHVVTDFYTAGMMTSQEQPLTPPDELATTSRVEALEHEALGGFILKRDPELASIFERHGLSTDVVRKIFDKTDPENTLVEIISSDLDCDRLDYLRRTAHHTGLPYGSVDTDYLVSQATLDGDLRFSYTEKAARAADHLLVSRYYDYLQVPFHKTVAALEWSLVTCIRALLERGLLNCSTGEVARQLEEGVWGDFDDNYFIENLRALLRDGSVGAVTSDHLRAVLERKPAKSLFACQRLVDKVGAAQMTAERAIANAMVDEFCRVEGLDRDRFIDWEIKVKFARYQQAGEGEEQGGVRIKSANEDTSQLLCSMNDMLFSRLVGLSHRGYRILYLPPKAETAEVTGRIQSRLCEWLRQPNRRLTVV